MPLPVPRPGESEDKFISRCMADDVMNKEFPMNKQRFAVCKSIYDKKDKSQRNIKNERKKKGDKKE